MSKRDRKQHEMTVAPTPAKAEVASPAVVSAPVVEPVPELPAEVHVEAEAPPQETSRPTLEQLQASRPRGVVEVSLASPGPARLVAGLVVYAAPRQHRVELVAEHGESHLRALAADPTITVRLVS